LSLSEKWLGSFKTKPTGREKRLPGQSREAAGKCTKGLEALAHLFGAGAGLQPVARGVEDMARSMLGESTSRVVQGRRQVQALQSRTSLA